MKIFIYVIMEVGEAGIHVWRDTCFFSRDVAEYECQKLNDVVAACRNPDIHYRVDTLNAWEGDL